MGLPPVGWFAQLVASAAVFMSVIWPGVGAAAEWGSCHDDLDRLRRAARDASGKAEEVNSKARDVESAKSQLSFCSSRDCSWERLRYNSAVSYYNSAKSDLESELDTVASRVRSAEYSCSYDLGSGRIRAPGPRPPDGWCAVLHRFKGSLPQQTLIDACKKSRPEEDCKRCLE
jgi:hypothetical protein